MFFFELPFPVIVIAAALCGYLLQSSTGESETSVQDSLSRFVRSTVTTVAVWSTLWASPLILVGLFSTQDFLLDMGLFFSKLAVVTFGGAYAVLAYLAQDVVTTFGWLAAGEMMDGLGVAETTPGPLILVTEFIGFVAGYGRLLAVAALAGVLTLFLPA